MSISVRLPLYSKDGKTLLKAPNTEEVIKVTEGTEFIGHDAFCLCSNLKRITLPRSMKKIERGAFEMCDNLKEVVYPKGMKMELRKMMENGMVEMPF